MNRRLSFPAALAEKLLALTVVAAACSVTPLAAQEQQVIPDTQNYSYARVVRLSLVEGQVQVLRDTQPDWEEALLNLPIRQGYQLLTASGRVEVEFESGATARLAENSLLRFYELALADGNRRTQLALDRGTGTFYANLGAGERFVVLTPFANVHVPENARFRVDVSEAGATAIVWKGNIEVEANQQIYRVTKNRAFTFRAADDEIILARAPEPDQWDRWVADRDEAIVASRERSRRYVGASYQSYGLSDLTNYGGWYDVPGYGYGWRPYGVSIGWMPYFSGYWYPFGGSFAWHSREPWGWLPYHFGSWIYSSRYGWVWIPGGHVHYWSPSRAYFIWSNNRLCWGPRSPHDRPGHPPVNLPHGTATFSGPPAGAPAGARPVGRIMRADLNPEPGMKVFWEAPAQLGDVARLDKGDVLRPNRFGPDGSPGASPGAVPAAADGPALKFSSAPRNVPRSALDPDAPEGAPRMREQERPAGNPAGGIVYDPESRRFVNNPNGPAATRTETLPDARPAQGAGGATGTAPAGRGSGNHTSTPAAQNPAAQPLRPYDSSGLDDHRGTSGMIDGKRRESQPRVNRYNEDPPPRSSPSAPAASPVPPPRPSYTPPPRVETPRYESPRTVSPAPAPTPRYESPRPASPPPRVEPPRPQSPPPRMEPPRPSTPPPAPPRVEGKPGRPHEN